MFLSLILTSAMRELGASPRHVINQQRRFSVYWTVIIVFIQQQMLLLCLYCVSIFLCGFGFERAAHREGEAAMRGWGSCLALWCDGCIFRRRSWWSTSVSWSRRWEQRPVPSGALPQLPLQVNGVDINLLYALQMWTIKVLTIIQQQH